MKSLLLILLIIMSPSALAESFLQVEEAWVRQPPPGAVSTAAYFTVRNSCASDYYITAAESPVFGSVEFHQSIEEDGLAKMRHQNYYVVLANGVFQAQPGGYHMMLFQWDGNLQEGDSIPFRFKLGNGDFVSFEAIVKRN